MRINHFYGEKCINKVNYAENDGSGTTDMISLCREAGICPPVYQYDHGEFRTFFYRNTHPKLSNRLSNRLSDKLSDRRIAILQKMIGNPQVPLTDLAQQTGISRATIMKNLV